jgi:hypothetical protein
MAMQLNSGWTRLDPLNGRLDGRRADRLHGSAAGLHVEVFVQARRFVESAAVRRGVPLVPPPDDWHHRLAGDVAAHDDDVRLIEGADVEELGPADLRAVNVGDVEDLGRFSLIVISLPGLSDAPGCLEALENGLFDRARRKTVAYADHMVAVVGQLVQQVGVVAKV